jgi:hypothetical protein
LVLEGADEFGDDGGEVEESAASISDKVVKELLD